MGAINALELKRRYELEGPRSTVQHLREALTEGLLKPVDFSIRDLAESLVPDGREWVNSLNPKHGGLSLLESEAVNTSAFSNITGQIVYNAMLDGYQSEEFVVSRLIAATRTEFDGEKIPGVTRIGDKAEIVEEGQLYPHVGVSEDYIETPRTTKRGEIVPVTKEAIAFDRTGLILRRAAEVGESLGLNKEKRLIDVLIGATNNYKWRGTTYSTYVSTPWDNTLGSTELLDWSDIDAAEQHFAAMTDPNTGEPLIANPSHIVVHTAKQSTARRIMNATEVRVATPGYATSGNPTETLAANFVNQYQIVSSRLINARMSAASHANTRWWLMNPAKAFAYFENWPITVVQAPSNSEAEFTRDIVLRFKASERGAAAVIEPRYAVEVQA